MAPPDENYGYQRWPKRWTDLNLNLAPDPPSIFRAMSGYPWLPCPICGGTESCDDTVLERARAAHPGLIVPEPNRQ